MFVPLKKPVSSGMGQRGGVMEQEVFTKKSDKRVTSSVGFEVDWEAKEVITYVEPPRRMLFSVDGYWGDDGVWQHEIFVPAEPRWLPPHQTETLSQDHLAVIRDNLLRALDFLYRGVPFEMRESG
jgi:hypothetical protein